MPTPEYHALLSPSSAARWINCPASVALTKDKPDETSEYAEAGRLAHEIAELKAQHRFLGLSKRTYTSRLKALQEDPRYDRTMDSHTDRYTDTLSEHAMSFASPPFIALETPVPIGVITGEHKDDGSPATGTADCIMIGDGVLWVHDYKNGSGVPVSAEGNPQMMLYALGALTLYRPFYGDSIGVVRMTIIQPALDSVSTWETTRTDLEEWGRAVAAPAASKALAGLQDPTDAGEPTPGEWCKSHFCPLRYTCRALASSALSLEEFRRSLPAELSSSEIGDVLTRGALLVSWYNDVKDYALAEILAGREIPGWKAVEGRASREWDDVDTAFKDLMARGVDESLLWVRSPVTAPALEKSLGKKTFDELASDHVVKRPGKPALAPENDKRPPYNPAFAAFGYPRIEKGEAEQ